MSGMVVSGAELVARTAAGQEARERCDALQRRAVVAARIASARRGTCHVVGCELHFGPSA